MPGAGRRMVREFPEYRPWKTWAQFDKEIGKYVGPEATAKLAQYTFIPMNANTAADADLMTVPGANAAWVDKLKKGRPVQDGRGSREGARQGPGPLLRHRIERLHGARGSPRSQSSFLAARRPRARRRSHQHEAGRLGTVTFANSCSADVQPAFARGMALLHSFEFGPGDRRFQEVSEADPSCAIALWGIGLAEWDNPFSPGCGRRGSCRPDGRRSQRAAAVGAKTDASARIHRRAAPLLRQVRHRRSARARARVPRCHGAGSPRHIRTIRKRRPSTRCARGRGGSRPTRPTPIN